MALLVAACASPHPPEPSAVAKTDDIYPETPKPVNANREQAGREKALRDIAAGDPHLVFIGLPSASRSPLDLASGLPTDSIGCIMDEGSAAYVQGYNDATLAAVKAGTARTYADRATTADAISARLAAADVVELSEANPSVAAPGGKLRVELGTVTYSFDRPGEPPTPYLFVVDVASSKREQLDYLGEMRARVAFDHAGATLVVRDERFRRSMTYDLTSRRMLQQFSDPRASK